MNIDIDLIKKNFFRNYNNKKINRIMKRYENIMNHGDLFLSSYIYYYNRNNELIIDFKPRDDIIKWKFCNIYEIREKLINDINKEKFKMSIYYMKKKKITS